MHAVNLLPTAERDPATAARKQAPSALGGSFVLLALGVVLVCTIAYVVTANGVDQRQRELTVMQSELATTQARAAALAPARAYTAAVAERSARVKALADQRLRWDRTLGELARALPADARVTDVSTTPSAAADAGAAAGAPVAPTMVLTGCVPSQDGIPDLLSRVGDLRGATRAVLGTSRRTEDDADEDGTCRSRSARFEVTVSFGGWVTGA